MEFSPTIDLISTALAQFQSEVTSAKKSSANPFFKSSYADLAEIWDTIRKPLAANHLAVVQSPEFIEGRVQITTLITHKSGQWIKGAFSLTPVKNDPQALGSAVTYGRRYSLAAFLGVAQDDDDGNAASGKQPENNNKISETLKLDAEYNKIAPLVTEELIMFFRKNKTTKKEIVELFGKHKTADKVLTAIRLKMVDDEEVPE